MRTHLLSSLAATHPRMKRNYKRRTRGRFTHDNLISFSYFDEDNTLYGTNTGKVFLYNHVDQRYTQICDVSGNHGDGVKSI